MSEGLFHFIFLHASTNGSHRPKSSNVAFSFGVLDVDSLISSSFDSSSSDFSPFSSFHISVLVVDFSGFISDSDSDSASDSVDLTGTFLILIFSFFILSELLILSIDPLFNF